MRPPIPPFSTWEEGRRIFNRILEKGLLCHHDVEELISVYRQMVLLEKKIDLIPADFNSKTHAVDAIMHQIVFKKSGYNQLVSLHHLRQFCDQGVVFKREFREAKKKWLCDEFLREYIAEIIPCCHSEEVFNNDIKSILGSNLSDKESQILNLERKNLRRNEQLKKLVAEKKTEIQESRNKNLQHYPTYLDELLDKGYLHLYDHLIKIRSFSNDSQMKAEIEKMTVSEFTHVVLEAREAIIRKVKAAIDDYSSFIVFLIGESGAGKSTTFCFLRGDTMVLQGDMQRYTSKSDQSGLIGHELATSCTFLPNIARVCNTCFIVDFPGFDDTNGPIVSLGIECALKALIHEYNPKILLIESIINMGGRGQTAGRLGNRLSRILDNKQDCVLGITKYSQDPDFIEVSKQEKKQKETLEKLEQKEKKLLAGISDPGISPKKKSKREEKLEKVRSKKEGKKTGSPDLHLRKKSIDEKEKLLLEKTGLKSLIPLHHLEDSNVDRMLLTIYNQESVRVNSKHCLDPNDEQLVNELFKSKLQHDLKTKEGYSFDTESFYWFEDEVFESSLIRFICGKSNSEIGDFLHLPEIDFNLVHKFDQYIVSTAITKFIEYVISTCSLSSMDKAVAEFKGKASQAKMELFQNKLNQLKEYIMFLSKHLPEDEKKSEEEWIRIEMEYQAAKNADSAATWERIRNYLSLLLPESSINWLKEYYEDRELRKRAIEMTIDKCINSIDHIYDVLQRLKVLEGTIEKKQEIKHACLSVEVNNKIVKVKGSRSKYGLTDLFHQGFLDIYINSSITLKDLCAFHSSIQQSIDKVSRVYGVDWNNRVKTWMEQLKESPRNVDFDQKNPIHIFCVMLLAGMLSNPDWSSTEYWNRRSWSLDYHLAITNFDFKLFNNEIIFTEASPDIYIIDESKFYLSDLSGFNVHHNNFIARMMLADAILKTHPFTL
jgi:hypothetical protein